MAGYSGGPPGAWWRCGPRSAAYAELHPVPSCALPRQDVSCAAYLLWERLLEGDLVSAGSLRAAGLLRAAPLLPVQSDPVFTCGYCRRPCFGWGAHLLHDCPLTALAVIYAFRGVAVILQRAGWHVQWVDTTSLWAATAAAGRWRWTLCADCDTPVAASSPAENFVTWSGLVWATGGCGVSVVVQEAIMTTFLARLEDWLASPRDLQWHLLRGCAAGEAIPDIHLVLAAVFLHVLGLSRSACHGTQVSDVSLR